MALFEKSNIPSVLIAVVRWAAGESVLPSLTDSISFAVRQPGENVERIRWEGGFISAYKSHHYIVRP